MRLVRLELRLLMRIKVRGKNKTVVEIVQIGVRLMLALISAGFAIIPKLVFGNSVGFKHNIWPRIELWRIRRKPDQQSVSFDQSAKIAATQLEYSGVKIFRHRGDLTRLQAIRDRLDAICADDRLSLSSPNGSQRRIIEPMAVLPELSYLITDEISQTIKAYYRCAFRIFSVQVWRNFGIALSADARDRLDMMSNTLHNDFWPVTSLRLFIILSDKVTKQTGAFRYYDKKDTQTIIRSLSYFDRFHMPSQQRKRLYDPQALQYFEGALGDACLVNTQELLHGSSIPEVGAHRDVVQFLIVPSSDYRRIDGPELFQNLPPDPEMVKILRDANRT